MRAPRDWTWSVPVLAAGTLLLFMALTRLIVGLSAISESQQLDYGEPIVYGLAARLVAGQPLYQPLDRPPFTVAAYTPLYYVLASGLQAFVGSGFGPGRALSYVAGLASGLAVAWLAAQHTRSARAGAFAALIYFGVGFPGTVPWFALYRVDMLAEALSLGAIVVLTSGTTARYLVIAGLLAGLALLTKQSFVAATLAGTVWLWTIAPRRSLLFGGTALVLAIGASVAEQLSTGAFLANAVVANANPINLEEAHALVVQFGQTLGLPLAGACGYVWLTRARHGPSTRLLVVYWLASALQLTGLLKFGAIYNYWIEFGAATAVLATLGLWTATTWQAPGPRLVSRVLVWGLIVELAVLAPDSAVEAASGFINQASLTGQQPTNRAEFQALINLVHDQRSEVLGDPLDVVVLGGHQVLLEPVIFSILDGQGQWNPRPLVNQICAGNISLLVLGAPLDVVAAFAWNGQPWWPPQVMHALQQRMRAAGQRAGRYLYVPADANASEDC